MAKDNLPGIEDLGTSLQSLLVIKLDQMVSNQTNGKRTEKEKTQTTEIMETGKVAGTLERAQTGEKFDVPLMSV
jgi:hypothetical protein